MRGPEPFDEVSRKKAKFTKLSKICYLLIMTAILGIFIWNDTVNRLLQAKFEKVEKYDWPVINLCYISLNKALGLARAGSSEK